MNSRELSREAATATATAGLTDQKQCNLLEANLGKLAAGQDNYKSAATSANFATPQRVETFPKQILPASRPAKIVGRVA